MHRILKQIVIDGISKWDEKRIKDQMPSWRSQLQGLGLTSYDHSLRLLQRSVEGCINDKNNHWIFDSSHKESKCEYRVGYKPLEGDFYKNFYHRPMFYFERYPVGYRTISQLNQVKVNLEIFFYVKK
jgi:hypothetical protein